MNNSFRISTNRKKGFVEGIRSYFKFDSYNAIFKKEIIGGLSTFLAMCYILSVNPAIVGETPIDPKAEVIETAKQYQGGLFLVTALCSFLGTMFMGLWARIPVAVAPGMGLNAFFAYTVGAQVGFQSALSVTIMSGILYLIVALTPIRNVISKQIPHNFKIAIGASIGLFIAYLGLQNAGIIIADGKPLVSKIGDFSNPLVILALCLIILGLILHFSKIPGAIIITMIIGSFILMILAFTGVINKGMPHYGLLGEYSNYSTFVDVAKAGWLGFANIEMWKNPITYIGILSFLYMDFFDTTGSLIVINRMVGFDKTDPKWISKANQTDAICTIVGAGLGATTMTTFVESTVGVEAGAKTGFASVVTSLMFALSIALWPILQVMMPILYNGSFYQPVTSPALIIVGSLMLSQIKYFEWEIVADIPMLFITMLMMTLTNSIAHGLSFGMIVYVFMNLGLGIIQKIKHRKKVVNDILIPIAEIDNKLKTREFNYFKRINWTCIVVTIISIAYIVLEAGSSIWF